MIQKSPYLLFDGLTEEEKKDVVSFLESNGFEPSEYGTIYKEAKGICIAITYDLVYVFLSDYMMSTNPYISWICCRSKVDSIEEFKSRVLDELKRANEKIENFTEFNNSYIN